MNVANILRKSNNWQDFKTSIQPLSKKQKGDCFEALTKNFIQLHPKYNTQLKNVWYLSEVPHHVNKNLNLPRPDEGIDLIAETKDDRYWAIQCKYREDGNKSLTRKELSTFTDLAFGICKNIELGLVCTSADRFSYKLTMYGERLSFCAGDVWRGLEKEFFNRLHSYLDRKTISLNPLKPREHQRKSIQQGYKHFIKEKNSRGKLLQPCGTGKTLTAYWLARKLNARTILVAVPSLSLIRQTLEVWTRESVANQQEVHWIAVCSDDTVGDFNREDVAVLTQDLGVRIHTDPDEIARWLKGRKGNTTIVFTTYQSSRSTAGAARRAGIVFDVGIMDEAHKTVGKKDSLFSHLLYDDNIRIKKRIFMTATERRYKGNSDEIASMDDPDLYGETFELLSFKKALESRPAILSDYKIVTIQVTRSEVARLIKRNVFVKPDRGKWGADVEAESFAAMIALRKAMHKYPIRHAISFHNSIARAMAFKINQDNFTSTFPEYGELDTFHVSGKTPTAVRSRQIDTFEAAKRGLITNARCLTEGVDVPSIDCILFADPRKSAVDIVQAVGRALRPVAGKKFGYVVVPVLLDDKVTDGIPLQKNAFDEILMTLRALAANDERIIEYFRSVSQGKRRSRGTRPIEIDIPVGVVVDAESFVNSLKLHFWSRLAKLSWRDFGEARAFVRSLGIKNQKEWAKYCKGKLTRKGTLPEDIPATPASTYKDKGWKGLGNWLGTGTVATQDRKYRSFKEARSFVRNLGFKSRSEWSEYCKGKLPEKGELPEDIPAGPARTYKDSGWKGMGDWLGTGTDAPFERKYRSFKEAREFVRSLGLKNSTEWRKYCKSKLPEKGTLPQDIPAASDRVYKDQWNNWGDWLGTGTVAPRDRKYRSFKKARAFVRSLGLKNWNEWSEYCKGKLPENGSLPEDMPASPERVYKDKGWKGMGDWLGTGIVASQYRKYRSFKKARAFVRSLGLKNWNEWGEYCRNELPDDIPKSPQNTYKDMGYKGMGDWLGTGSVATQDRKYRPFKEARVFSHSLRLKNQNEWTKYCKGELPKKRKLPQDIPNTPHHVYKGQGWKGIGDWLGTGIVAPRNKKYCSFKKARAFVRSLGIKNQKEWIKYCKGELHKKVKFPEDIPAKPQRVYKDKGWKGMGDWLGTGTVATRNRKFLTFKESHAYIRNLGLMSETEWRKYCKGELLKKGMLPKDIPTNPQRAYKDKGWNGWKDWLGTVR